MCLVSLLAFQDFIVEPLNSLTLIIKLQWTYDMSCDMSYIYLKEANNNRLNF